MPRSTIGSRKAAVLISAVFQKDSMSGRNPMNMKGPMKRAIVAGIEGKLAERGKERAVSERERFILDAIRKKKGKRKSMKKRRR